jgi:Cellulose binding domain
MIRPRRRSYTRVRLRGIVERHRRDRLVPVLFFVHALVAVVLIAMLTAGTVLAGNRSGASPRTGDSGDRTAATAPGQNSGPAHPSASSPVPDGTRATAAATSVPGRGASATTAATNSPAPQTSASCLRVTHQMTSQWSTGLQVQYTVANCGAAPVNGWAVAVTFSDKVDLQVWSAIQDNGAPTVRFSALAYDSVIPPGKTVTFGFNATWSGAARTITGCAVASGSCA